MVSLYKDMTLQERDRLIKFLLCTVLGITISMLVGDPYSATTAVTANLFLYTDRGYYGGIRYAMKRIEVQIIQGGLVLFIIFPCRYCLNLPVSDTVLIIIASCFAILIGLPLNYKHQIAPYHTTLANATFILAAGTVQNIYVYPYRILHCTVGFFIGYLVNCIIMPQRNRYTDTVSQISLCTLFLLDKICNKKNSRSNLNYSETKSSIMSNVKFLFEDHAKGLKRHKRTPQELLTIKNCLIALDFLEHVSAKLPAVKENISCHFWDSWQSAFEADCQWHREFIKALSQNDTRKKYKNSSFQICPDSNEEVILLSWLIQYEQVLNNLASSKDGLA